MAEYLSDLNYKGNVYRYIDLKKASALLGGDIKKLPYSIRILFESVLRKEDGIDVTKDNICSLMHYQAKSPRGEVPFKPAELFSRILRVFLSWWIWLVCAMLLSGREVRRIRLIQKFRLI